MSESLGTKILIVGTSASGKSTFARKLAAKTKLPLIHIDSIMWQPGWDYIGDTEAISKIREISQQDSWIIEGFMFETVVEDLLRRADMIIYLDYSRLLMVWWYLKRTWRHHKNSRPEIPGCPDSFSISFMWRIFLKKEVYWLEKTLQSGDYEGKLRRLFKPLQADELLELL